MPLELLSFGNVATTTASVRKLEGGRDLVLQRLGHDIAFAGVLDHRVGDLGMERDREVGRNRPRRGRPDHEGERLVRRQPEFRRTSSVGTGNFT